MMLSTVVSAEQIVGVGTVAMAYPVAMMKFSNFGQVFRWAKSDRIMFAYSQSSCCHRF